MLINSFLDNKGPIYCQNNLLNNCWNGTHNVTRFSGLNFTTTSIEGQSKSDNPVYKILSFI